MGTVNPSQSNPGDTIEASDVNTPVNQLAAVINGNIETVNIADNSVTTAKMADASVTPGKLATGAATATVATSETTTSTSFTDLATAGPAVTVTIGSNGLALVSLYSGMANAASTTQPAMGFAISGATTTAASHAFAIATNIAIAGGQYRVGSTFLVTGLNPGSTTFTAKYLSNANVSTFVDRRISVVPL